MIKKIISCLIFQIYSIYKLQLITQEPFSDPVGRGPLVKNR